VRGEKDVLGGRRQAEERVSKKGGKGRYEGGLKSGG